MPELGYSACGLTFQRFPSGETNLTVAVWLCTTPGHREYGSAYPKEVNCDACKPAVVDAALKKYDFNACDECGEPFGDEEAPQPRVRVISGDGKVRCAKCNAARLHPALKR